MFWNIYLRNSYCAKIIQFYLFCLACYGSAAFVFILCVHFMCRNCVMYVFCK